MNAVSSQDFRNAYEKLYDDIRRYLWPLDTLEILSDIEVNIYSVFINISKLEKDFLKLRSAVKDVVKDDKYLAEDIAKIQKCIDSKEGTIYSRLPRVNESNPENMKQLKTIPDKEE